MSVEQILQSIIDLLKDLWAIIGDLFKKDDTDTTNG